MMVTTSLVETGFHGCQSGDEGLERKGADVT